MCSCSSGIETAIHCFFYRAHRGDSFCQCAGILPGMSLNILNKANYDVF